MPRGLFSRDGERVEHCGGTGAVVGGGTKADCAGGDEDGDRGDCSGGRGAGKTALLDGSAGFSGAKAGDDPAMKVVETPERAAPQRRMGLAALADFACG